MIAYLHGFNSSPGSHKAKVLRAYMAERGLENQYECPTLPPLAEDAIRVCDELIRRRAGEPVCMVGSSLGGFYATHLAERHGLKAVLINPAIDPHVGLRAYLGQQKNLYTGEPYELTARHLEQWRALHEPRISPERYLLIVETADEVLDYRRAVERYAGARQVVVPGGDHSLQSFPRHLPEILRFCGLAG